MKKFSLFLLFMLVICVCHAHAIPDKISDSLQQRIQRVEQENRDLRTKFEYIDKLYDKRFDDFTKWLGILIGLVVGGAVLIGFSSNRAARKQAIEELQALQAKITALEESSSNVSQQLSNAETRLQVFQQISNPEREINDGPDT